MKPPLTKCQECGGMLDEEDLFCSNCGLSVAFSESDQPSTLPTDTPSHYFTCDGCGASMSYDASAQKLRCPFCGSEQLSQESPRRTLTAERVVPVGVERHQAERIVRTWMGQGFWRPARVASEAILTQLTLVYAPYWVFSAETATYWTADVAEGAFRGTWRPVTGSHHGTHSGLLIGASSVLTQQETAEICPFELESAVPAHQVNFSNATVEQFSVPRKYARPLARQRIEEQELRTCAGSYLNVQFRNLRVNVKITHMSGEPVLLPVWISAYQYRGTLYRSLVNGQTGQIIGSAPFSYGKLAILVLILVVAAIISMALLPGMSPRTL